MTATMPTRVLIVGAGGREHAIAWKLRQSPMVDEIFVAPGNPGTAQIATNLVSQPKDIEGIVKEAIANRVDFYLASMDDPQPLGLVDRLTEAGILCYGPTQAAAQLESSKDWSKEFMVRNGIRTATSRTFTDYATACAYVESLDDKPVAVKASGLAAGKGVIVCNDGRDALEALDIIMKRRDVGSAGDSVLIEERLYGWETSCLAFCDGNIARLMPFSSDYKRAQDGDIGLNTGGMGAYAPSIGVTPAFVAAAQRDIVDPTMRGMSEMGIPFCGTLYPGLMETADGTYVIEYNARWGDPETQVLMPLLQSDLFEVCEAAALGKLETVDVRWSTDACVGVVIASGGYPATYKLGHIIEGIDEVDADVQVFHSGTKNDVRGLVTNGGRVVTVVATGPTLDEARAKAYDNVRRIRFADSFYRTDIALPKSAF